MFKSHLKPVALLGALTLSIGMSGSVSAATLDQSQIELDGNTSHFPGRPKGQTFTVGVAGILDSVEVLLSDYDLGDADFELPPI